MRVDLVELTMENDDLGPDRVLQYGNRDGA